MIVESVSPGYLYFQIYCAPRQRGDTLQRGTARRAHFSGAPCANKYTQKQTVSAPLPEIRYLPVPRRRPRRTGVPASVQF